MTPAELLLSARQILAHTGGLVPALWPRAAAILARHALESAVRDMWMSRPGYESLVHSSMRAQLITLVDIVDPQTAARAAFVWSALSEACHYHPYELAPTVGELGHWIDEVEEILTPSVRPG
ncbi:MAG TPA: hypothetical protein VMY88_12195 [Acidimicrobiales bacterium]|nr:hypothetical protein [Acidimicrobiales bacterium]